MSRVPPAAWAGLILTLGLSGLVPLQAAGPLEWSLAAQAGLGFGHTTYLMSEPDPSSLGVSSELVFPLDTPLLALTASLQEPGRTASGWWLRLHVATSLGQPWSLMTDGDWYLYQNYPPIAFSYTESEAEMRRLTAGIEGGLVVWRQDRLAIAIAGLYRFQYIDQDIIGYQGWQYYDADLNDEFELYVMSDTAPALYYRIMYHLPGVGLAARLDFPGVELEASAAYTLLYVSDYDDHLLRYKLSTAQGWGHGLIAAASGRYFFPGTRRPRIHAGARVDLVLLRADTKQTQEFYAGPDAGLIFTGLSHLITSAQLEASLGVGVSF